AERVPSSTTARPSVAAPALSAPPETAEQPFRFPGAERVVALGDLHGDLASTREALRLAGAVDDGDRWIGGKLVLVQVGDQLDRGDDEPEILELLERLAADATKSGGALHVLNGNHEVMNVAGDLRYVTEDGFRDYAATVVPAGKSLPSGVNAEARGRAAAFLPGSPIARKLALRNTIAIVGDTLFAHAGVLPKHVRYGIGRINDEVRRFLRGESATLPEIAGGEEAPIWTRAYGGPAPETETCRELEAVLASLAVKRLVVGHTVQKNGITRACNDRVFRVDVGLSDYYGKNATQALEIRATGVKVLGSR
ncbi:MAG TPA: metallophosphoesterase, partial [Polyangiaceae bacterium]